MKISMNKSDFLRRRGAGPKADFGTVDVATNYDQLQE